MENETLEQVGAFRGYVRFMRDRVRDPRTRLFMPLGVVSIIRGFVRSPLWGLELLGILLAVIALGSIVSLLQVRRRQLWVPRGESFQPSSDEPPPEPDANNCRDA